MVVWNKLVSTHSGPNAILVRPTSPPQVEILFWSSRLVSHLGTSWQSQSSLHSGEIYKSSSQDLVLDLPLSSPNSDVTPGHQVVTYNLELSFCETLKSSLLIGDDPLLVFTLCSLDSNKSVLG